MLDRCEAHYIYRIQPLISDSLFWGNRMLRNVLFCTKFQPPTKRRHTIHEENFSRLQIKQKQNLQPGEIFLVIFLGGVRDDGQKLRVLLDFHHRLEP